MSDKWTSQPFNENGYAQAAHFIFEDLFGSPHFTRSESMVMAWICRWTVGYHTLTSSIAVSSIAAKVGKGDRYVRKILKGLKEDRVISITPVPGKPNEITFNPYPHTWINRGSKGDPGTKLVQPPEGRPLNSACSTHPGTQLVQPTPELSLDTPLKSKVKEHIKEKGGVPLEQMKEIALKVIDAPVAVNKGQERSLREILSALDEKTFLVAWEISLLRWKDEKRTKGPVYDFIDNGTDTIKWAKRSNGHNPTKVHQAMRLGSEYDEQAGIEHLEDYSGSKRSIEEILKAAQAGDKTARQEAVYLRIAPNIPGAVMPKMDGDEAFFTHYDFRFVKMPRPKGDELSRQMAEIKGKMHQGIEPSIAELKELDSLGVLPENWRIKLGGKDE